MRCPRQSTARAASNEIRAAANEVPPRKTHPDEEEADGGEQVHGGLIEDQKRKIA